MIVLPMAGLSSRFFKAGFAVPKYMLTLQDRTVFAHAICSFEAYFETESFLIICRDVYDTPAFVARECAALGIPDQNLFIVTLTEETGGQAETVAKGLEQVTVAADEPLTIFNIDTFRPGFDHPDGFDIHAVDGYLEVFRGPGTHWSFVKPDLDDPEAHRALEVAEKVRISDLCSTGLYYFRRADLFAQLYGTIATRDPATLQGGERYIAPLYNIALQDGRDIRYRVINSDDVLFCGTPDEYHDLQMKMEA